MTEFPLKTPIVPGDWLEALAVVKLRRTEWRVIAIVLSSPDPVTASSLAKRFHLDYGLVKRVVRELIGWSILERTPAAAFVGENVPKTLHGRDRRKRRHGRGARRLVAKRLRPFNAKCLIIGGFLTTMVPMECFLLQTPSLEGAHARNG